MTSDRRKKRKLTREDVEQHLNSRQLTALAACRHFGWRLKFIRSPRAQEPVPVLYNTEIDRIGILEPDGHINVEPRLELRTDQDTAGQVKQPARQSGDPQAGHWKEKRQDMVPVPGNLDELLSKDQMLALRQIETFGWELHFVRRPLFQDPVPVILSPEGDRYATVEPDGRINMTPESVMRKEAPTVPAARIKQAG